MNLKLIYKKVLKLSFFIIFLGFYACAEPPKEFLQCSVLIDVTSSNTLSLINLKKEDFLSVLDLDKNRDNEIVYRQAFITETFLNFTHQFKLSPAPPKLMSNEFDREEEITAFKNKIIEALSLISQEMMSGGRQYSSVYVPFAREVNRLARQARASKKLLLLFSDLTENSDFMSLFQKKFQDDLRQSPEVIEEYFQKELSLADDLSSIIIYIIHQPRNEDNVIFKKLSRIYRSMLEKRGATVIVQANLMR